MKRAWRVCALLAALAAPMGLTAQSASRPVGLGMSGGLSLPVGDFGEGLDAGYSIAGHLFFKPAALTSLRLRADVSADSWAFDGTGSTFRTLGVIGNALYDFPTRSSTSISRPYLLGGLGLVHSRDGEFDVSDTNLGFQVGGGLGFQLSGFSTFAEAKFVNVFGDGGSARSLPITFGVRF